MSPQIFVEGAKYGMLGFLILAFIGLILCGESDSWHKSARWSLLITAAISLGCANILFVLPYLVKVWCQIP